MKLGTLASPEGLWLIDKPKGISSFAVVGQMRRITGVRKIGHAGTLDPLATGLMLVLVGRDFTRQADQLIKLRKSYDMNFRLGNTSTTDDAEGELTVGSDRVPTEMELLSAISTFCGEILQTPPAYSAIKLQGQRAYRLARQGMAVDIPARPVTVYSWELTSYTYPDAQATVDVSSGTYIRSLARNLGETLGTGAYLTDLRRTRVGEYSLDDAQILERLV